MTNLFSNLPGDSVLTRIVLYQTIGQLLSGALMPYSRALEYGVNSLTPNAALSPVELAVAVVRGFRSEVDAAAEAAKNGINAERFRLLTNIAQQAPPPEMLAVALRRRIIPLDAGDPEGVGFVQGIAQGNLGNKWSEMVRELSTQIPNPSLALAALLEGQTDHDTAIDLYQRFGGDPQYFELAYNTEGSAPTPVQAAEMANRRIIPWDGEGAGVTSFRQAFLEGPWRNKWLGPFRELAEYLPPPRTVTAMVREGVLTDVQATDLFQRAGLSPELATAYLRAAHHTKTQAAHELGRSTVEALYRDRIIDAGTATTFLTDIGYSERDAGFLLAIQDLALQQTTISSVISRIRTLYTGYKITPESAAESLTTLGVSGARQAEVLSLWNLQRVESMRQLTEAQIAGAYHYKVIDYDAAQTHLVSIGYTPHDAWILLSEREHAALPNEPPKTAIGNAPGYQT